MRARLIAPAPARPCLRYRSSSSRCESSFPSLPPCSITFTPSRSVRSPMPPVSAPGHRGATRTRRGAIEAGRWRLARRRRDLAGLASDVVHMSCKPAKPSFENGPELHRCSCAILGDSVGAGQPEVAIGALRRESLGTGIDPLHSSNHRSRKSANAHCRPAGSSALGADRQRDTAPVGC